MSGDRVAIVGIGTTNFGDMYRTRDPGRSAYSLAGEAFRAAVEDCGIDLGAIDGLICCRVPSYARMADMLGIHHPRLIHGLPGSGRMSGLAVQLAMMAIQTGQASVVACVYGNDGRSRGAKYGGAADPDSSSIYDASYGMTSPGAYVALMYRRYAQLYGAPDDALAPLAISNREYARMNPVAVMREPLTTEQYMESRFIAEPLRLYDYCLINDGAVSMILARADIARRLRRTPAFISGTAATGSLTNFYTSTDFFAHACHDVAKRVYEQSGVGPADVDCFEIYDNFTPTILFSLEGFGICAPGEAWKLVRDGRTAPGGSLPINTSGGHTSESYMQGWALHVEAVRQLRGEAGARQVKDCSIVQYICAAPITTSHILTLE